MSIETKSKPSSGRCLLCGNRDDIYQDLIGHIRINHSDQTPEIIAELMVRIGDLEKKIEGLSSCCFPSTEHES